MLNPIPGLRVPVANVPNSSSCTHKVCRHIGKPFSGVACLVLKQEYGAVWFLGGMEKGGKYSGELNVIGGKVDPEHKGCAYMAVVDELCQEAKICLHEVKACGHRHTGINWPLFDHLFKANGQLKWFIKDQTAVFYVKVSDLRRRDINHRIASDLMRPNLSRCEKEMSSVNWVRFSRREQVWKSPEGIIAPPSRYLQALISKVYEANDIRSDVTDFSFHVHRISDHVRKV